MASPETIAIDGPAASGKSTLGRALAEYLGYLYFDTGVMYRAVTLFALRQAVDLDDPAACSGLAAALRIDVLPPSKGDGRLYDVLVDGEDVTWQIRTPEVDANVSQVSTYPGVRSALTQQQRRIGLAGRVVMVGRDIGTVVLPEAPLKIYLVASVEERARRRFLESQGRLEDLSYEGVLESMRQRDRIDSSRELAPLRPAKDAVILSSDHIGASQVFEQVKGLLDEAGIRVNA